MLSPEILDLDCYSDMGSSPTPRHGHAPLRSPLKLPERLASEQLTSVVGHTKLVMYIT